MAEQDSKGRQWRALLVSESTDGKSDGNWTKSAPSTLYPRLFLPVPPFPLRLQKYAVYCSPNRIRIAAEDRRHLCEL